jgi:hypothetical protein
MKGRWKLKTPAVATGTLVLAVLLSAAALAQSPRRLPQPDLPLSAVPPAAAPATEAFGPKAKGATQRAAPYLGPPTRIDGPEALPPSANIDPGSGSIVMPESEEPAVPGEPASEAWPVEPVVVAAPQKLNPYKNGFFQKLSLAADWLGNSSDPADLGITEIEVFGQFGLPAPIREWPLLITKGINLTMIDGPTVTDLPPRLYYAYADFMWLPQIVKGYTLLLSVVPSEFGDFHVHQFRVTGKALMIVDMVPNELQFVGGVLYLNRDNLRLLPAGGFIWTPADWTRLELIFPKPKVGLRYNVAPGYEDWVYTTAEFGGNTWPILRANDVKDFVTYIDYRILIGCERKLEGGAGYRLEAGYVFGRDITFASGQGGFHPQDTFMLRGGITY